MAGTSGPTPLDDKHDDRHLSQIKTESLVRRWVTGKETLGDDVVAAARRRFFAQYYQPVYAYLRRLLRDPNATDDVYQEFAARVLQRCFRGYAVDRGRFRDYRKTTLRNMVVDHHRKVGRSKRGISQGIDLRNLEIPEPSEIDFALTARDSALERLLELTFSKLRELKQRTRPTYYDVLTYVVRHPEETSATAAEDLTRLLGLSPPLKPDALRQLIKRARDKFQELFIEELHVPAGPRRSEQIERRLIDFEVRGFFAKDLVSGGLRSSADFPGEKSVTRPRR
jgi:RNA polymerase sigma factor (sigma-70 family)